MIISSTIITPIYTQYFCVPCKLQNKTQITQNNKHSKNNKTIPFPPFYPSKKRRQNCRTKGLQPSLMIPALHHTSQCKLPLKSKWKFSCIPKKHLNNSLMRTEAKGIPVTHLHHLYFKTTYTHNVQLNECAFKDSSSHSAQNYASSISCLLHC